MTVDSRKDCFLNSRGSLQTFCLAFVMFTFMIKIAMNHYFLIIYCFFHLNQSKIHHNCPYNDVKQSKVLKSQLLTQFAHKAHLTEALQF